MADLVNTLMLLQREIQGSGITLQLENDQVRLEGPAGSACLRIVRLYRPSADDVAREASPKVLLVLMAATRKAVQAASQHNHIVAPGGGYRIVAPGIALIHDSTSIPTEVTRQVRLTGRTGVLAESLLLGGKRDWSVRDLAASSKVSPALAHRVVTRLEHEGLLTAQGHGPTTTRAVNNPRALAELWSQEEKLPKPILRGFLYGASTEALARKVLDVCPGCAVGGTLAANLYKPVLTRVAPPIRIWAPSDFVSENVQAVGFQQTDSGANIEFVQTRQDPWRVHMNTEGLPRVSQWRAWVEIARAEGRTQELAAALLADLE